MNIVDILMIVLLISYVLKGFKNGAIKETVTFVGGLLVLVISYVLKNPVSVYLYENLPFFNFGGIFAGVSVLNIVIYELIAFVAVYFILSTIYRILVLGTNIIETLLKVTVILEIPSKIIGLVVGFVEGIVIIFILLFIMIQFPFSRTYINESTYGNKVLTGTPILSDATEDIYKSLDEIYAVAEQYKDSSDKTQVNREAFEILLKYKILDVENANYLITTNKLSIDGAESIVEKYRSGE